MTLREALAELGVEPGARPEAVRRAYLRLLRSRKPESDPEGFRRLREAYELVYSSAAPGANQEDWSPAAKPDGGEDGPAAAAANLDAVEVGLATEQEPGRRLELLRQAIAEEPYNPTLRWWLASELDADDRAAEAVAVIRQADADGLPGFLEWLAAEVPQSLTPQELERLARRSDSPDALALAAGVHLVQGRPAEALAAMRNALDAANALGIGDQPRPWTVLRFLLAAYGAGEADQVKDVLDSLNRRLLEERNTHALRGGRDHFWWQVLQELAKLPAHFPDSLRRAAARAALEGDLALANEPFEKLAKRDPKEAEKVSECLYDTSLLYSAYYRILQGIKNDQPDRGEPLSAGGKAALWIFGFILLQGIIRSTDWPTRSSRTGSQHRLEGLYEKGDDLCRRQEWAICAPLRNVLDALRRTSCFEAEQAFGHFQAVGISSGELGHPLPGLIEQKLKEELAVRCLVEPLRLEDLRKSHSPPPVEESPSPPP